MNDATNTDTALNAAGLRLRGELAALVHELLGTRNDRLSRRIEDARAAVEAFDAVRAGRPTIVGDDPSYRATAAYWGRIAAGQIKDAEGPRVAAWEQVAACSARIAQDTVGVGAAVTVRSIAGAILA